MMLLRATFEAAPRAWPASSAGTERRSCLVEEIARRFCRHVLFDLSARRVYRLCASVCRLPKDFREHLECKRNHPGMAGPEGPETGRACWH